MNTTRTRPEGEEENSFAFDLWAEVYDKHDNPLLALEERVLKEMLPDLTGRSILDIGCGTGRWLEYFARWGTASSITGIDASSPMLDVAHRRRLVNTQLLQAKLPQIPLREESVDLVVASFVLSYISEIDRCACEMSRVLRPGGDAFITDMHPVTAANLGWERRFRVADSNYVVKARRRAIEETIEAMTLAGFSLWAASEPCFGTPEQPMFDRHLMQNAWQAAAGRPAIYVLHFKKAMQQRRPGEHHRPVLIQNAECVVGRCERIEANIIIDQKQIEQLVPIGSRGKQSSDTTINLDGYILFPGLINAHDHLEFALFPKLGAPLYRNATEWALDIQDRYISVIAKHKQVPKEVRIWWGALRNLLCGVTTVCHHNPIDQVMYDPAFPVKVLRAFEWEHSPAFARDLSASLKDRDEAKPFVIHACEGTDPVAANDFQVLKQAGAIDHRVILVHGLALTLNDIEDMNRHGASLVACMSSNHFLFAQTPSPEHLRAVNRLALGSDSPLTAIGDLLDEIRCCGEMSGLPGPLLFDAVTQQPARMLCLRDGEGRLAAGHAADMFAVRARKGAPSELLSSMHWYDVELVIVDGTVRLASPKMLTLLPDSIVQSLRPLGIDGIVRWLAAPTLHMFEAAAKVLGKNNVSISGRKISVMEA